MIRKTTSCPYRILFVLWSAAAGALLAAGETTGPVGQTDNAPVSNGRDRRHTRWGEGTGIFPGSAPPVRWDYDTGHNILWHTPTPTFGYGAPTVLKDRVVLLTEVDPEYPFPLLIGYDLATGAECWRTEVNPLPASIADPRKRKEIEDLWKATVRWRGEYAVLLGDWKAAADKRALAERMKRLGLKPDGDVSARGYPGKDAALDPTGPLGAHWTDPWKPLGQAGLVGDTWRYSGVPGGSWFFGETFATPVSDGERVYVQISWGVWAAYDRDGKLLWMQHKPSKVHGDHCQCGRSPFLWRGRLVADLGDWIRAFDCATGKLAWECSRKALGTGGHEMASPVVFTVAGKDWVYCNGYPPLAVRLEDGRAVKLEGPLARSPGIIVRGNPDAPDQLFLAGGGEHGGWEGKGKSDAPPPASIRIRPDGQDGLKVELLWSGIEGKQHGSQLSWMICHGGRLYYRDVILDAATGRLLIGQPGSRDNPGQAVPGSTLTLAVAGGRIYGQGYAEHGSEKRADDGGARVRCEVYDLAGHRLAVNCLRGLAGQAAMRRRNNIPNWFSYPNNFAVSGDRILTRSCNEVICVGDARRAFTPEERRRVAADLAGKPTLHAALAGLDAREWPRRLAAVQALGELGSDAAPAAGGLVERLKAADPARAETGFHALLALGPRAASQAEALMALAQGQDPIRRERALRALAGMGAAIENSLAAALAKADTFGLAYQVAARMDDVDVAARTYARGLLALDRAPQRLPWPPPFERFLKDGAPWTDRAGTIARDALAALGSRGKAATAVLAPALKPDDPARFMTIAVPLAAVDPQAVLPHLDLLRKLAGDARQRTDAVQILSRLGPAASAAAPELEALLADTKLDGRFRQTVEAALARIRPTRPPRD